MSAAEFVQLVEQYPCIYNSDLPDYARKDTTEVAWQEVANEMGWSVSECKDKWKNIRNGYVRSLKPSFKGVSKKPYYLCEALQFLLPYLNLNPVTNMNTSKLRSPKEEQITEQSEDILEPEEMEAAVIPEVVFRKPRKKIVRRRKTNAVDKAFVNWLRSRTPKESDSNKLFLLSLLPDVNRLTEEQLGVFRIKVLLLIEEVKEGRGLPKF